MLRIRLHYAKSKEAMYISHLDLMGVFERSLKRADINVKHSEGFNPRPEIVFAYPLSVGIESRAELCDVFLEEHYDESVFIKLLNNALPTGITILAASYVDNKEKSLMSQVESAVYEITFEIPEDVIYMSTPKELEKLNNEIEENFEKYYKQDEIFVNKKTKKGLVEVDIKKQIIRRDKLAPNKYSFKVRAGSVDNLKPELIVQGFEEFIAGKIDNSIKRVKIILA
ncbi:MAG: TIGR03936 family radical SAM-associated protein [Clostridia bacterium]